MTDLIHQSRDKSWSGQTGMC